MDFIKKYKKEIYKVIYLVCFIIFLVSLKKLIMESMDHVTLRSFWDFAFITEKNKLNWVALGALGVFISYWLTVKENSKKIDADLVAGARIKWIQEVRKVSGIIIGDYKKVISFNLKEEKVVVDNVEEFINNVEIMESNLNSLLLFFGDDTKEQELNTSLNFKDRKNNDGYNKNIISLIETSIHNIRYKQDNIKEKKELLTKIENNVYLNMEKEAEIKVNGTSMPSDIYLENIFENSPEALSEYSQGLNELNEIYNELKKIDSNLKEANLSLEHLRENFTYWIRSYLKIEWKNVSKKKS